MNRQARINREKGTDDEHRTDEYRKFQRDGTIGTEAETVPQKSESNKDRQGGCESNVQEGSPAE